MSNPNPASGLYLGPGVILPIDAVTQMTGIIGIRGSGKSHTASVFAEELITRRQQVVIIDPTDAWWGLRSTKDGRGPGFPITILGGNHSDLPLEASAGAVIADFVVDQRVSLILSVRHMSKSEQRQLMTAFCARLWKRKAEPSHKQPLQLMIDEASLFVPQRVMGEDAEMVGLIQRIVRQGRNSGFGVTLIDQRPATVNKDVLSQIELLICHRVIGPQDRKALESWIEAHDESGQGKEFMSSLASLDRGQAWAWSPGWLSLFNKFRVRDRLTFDSSATPKIGSTTAAPAVTAPVDLVALQADMASTIERAKADDPVALRRTIVELKNSLAAKTSTPLINTSAIAAAYREGYREGKDKLADRWMDASSKMNVAIRNMGEAFVEAIPARVVHVDGASGVAEVLLQDQAALPPSTAMNGATSVATSASSGSTSGLRRILIALAQCPKGLSAKQIGVRAGLSSSSGTFSNYLSRARTEEWIEGGRDLIRITKEGLQSLGKFHLLPVGRALLDYWTGELGGGAARMLLELYAVYPNPRTAEEIGAKAGISAASGTFSNYLSKLRTLELITGNRAALRASEELF